MRAYRPSFVCELDEAEEALAGEEYRQERVQVYALRAAAGLPLFDSPFEPGGHAVHSDGPADGRTSPRPRDVNSAIGGMPLHPEVAAGWSTSRTAASAEEQ
jgi:hypothetical protein